MLFFLFKNKLVLSILKVHLDLMFEISALSQIVSLYLDWVLRVEQNL